MARNLSVSDWEATSVVQMGGAAGGGGGLYFFEFRSKNADFRGQFVFVGGGVGAGGSVGGASAPSPADIYRNKGYNPFTKLDCDQAFTANDLDKSVGRISSMGASGAYGYSITCITALKNPYFAALTLTLFGDSMFHSQNVGGFGVGVGANVTIFGGVWKLIGESHYY